MNELDRSSPGLFGFHCLLSPAIDPQARGPKKHLKRLNAPKHWMLDKLGGIWAPRPSTGPHKMRECLPMSLILRNRLKYALTRREVQTIVMRKLIKVDGKIRTDLNFPCGFMDMITIEKSDDKFRVLYDAKGRFTLHRTNDVEAKFKLCRVVKLAKAGKGASGSNPFKTGQAAAIPYIVTHDGRTIRYPDPAIKANDTVKVDVETGKVLEVIKFEVGKKAYVTRGANRGRVGIIQDKERHPGSFDIVHLKDKRGHAFATRLQNVFVIGHGEESMVGLPLNVENKLSVIEQRDQAQKKKKSKKD